MIRSVKHILITLEMLFCFSYQAFLLGVLFMFINIPFRKLAEGEKVVEVIFTFIAMFGGVLGLLAIISLYFRIINIRVLVFSRKTTLLFLCCLGGASFLFMLVADFQLIEYFLLFHIAPIFCAIHFIYMQRSYFLKWK